MDKLRDFFEDLALRWDDQQPPDRAIVLHKLLAPFASILKESHAILEVGTGTGALIARIRERAPYATLVSIDLATEMLRRAHQRCSDSDLVQADAHFPPFTRSAFDFVICHNSFPHFANKPAAVVSLANTLIPGGRLLILHDLSREEVNAIHSNGGDVIKDDLLPSGDETMHLLLAHGFESIQVEDTPDHYFVFGALKE
jgi:ubiquinone/menaquinone biosynthesis C-methylase UbiE